MIGVDLVKIDRIKGFYDKYGAKAYERFLLPEEIKTVKSPQSAAGFWAAKEAISKALGCGISETCGFHDIWIKKDNLGKPYFTLSKNIIEKFHITDTSLSITHDSGFAISVASIESSTKNKNLSH